MVSTTVDAMEVTVRDHWRRRSRIPAPRPNGLRRSVGARAGRTRCERSGHRRSWSSLHASPPTDPAAGLCGFLQHRRVRRHGSVLPVGPRLPAPAPQAPGVDACLCASWREQAPGVDACLCASWREQAPGVDACLRASVPRGWHWEWAPGGRQLSRPRASTRPPQAQQTPPWGRGAHRYRSVARRLPSRRASPH